jgi:hypothetical protein
MTELETAIVQTLKDITLFCRHNAGVTLRSYQAEPAHAIVRSVLERQGLTFVVIFPRQSGKNELQAQLESYLLALLSNFDAEIVKVSPTWKPQAQNAMRRLERALRKNLVARALGWSKENGYIYRINQARVYFLSGAPGAHVVGATASTLLECDEAQDVSLAKWDKEFNPMAASTNATRLFWGTAWTSRTLLAREKRLALQAQAADGIRRVFELTADQVGAEVRAYRAFVDGEIAKLGRNHPFIRTQFFSEEIDAEAGMFPERRLALMRGSHPAESAPSRLAVYAMTIDVAGEDEFAARGGAASLAAADPGALANTRRDSTAVTLFRVDSASLDDPLIHAPTYRVVARYLWTGEKHTRLYAALRSLVDTWQPYRVIVDATGVGEALASFLDSAYPGVVIPFKFTLKSKSDLGWKFLAVIETGRFKDHSQVEGAAFAGLQAEFFNQCAHAQMEILEGPNQIMRWSVPDGTRDALTGELVHDDLLTGAALAALIDDEPPGAAASALIAPLDPLSEMRF